MVATSTPLWFWVMAVAVTVGAAALAVRAVAVGTFVILAAPIAILTFVARTMGLAAAVYPSITWLGFMALPVVWAGGKLFQSFNRWQTVLILLGTSMAGLALGWAIAFAIHSSGFHTVGMP